MKFIQSPALNPKAIEMALKPNERIVCTNATVAVDENGNVSAWFRNDVPLVIVEE